MKKSLFFGFAALALVSCGNKTQNQEADAAAANDSVPAYTVREAAQVDLASYPVDEEGYYVIFNGKNLDGWRGYGRDTVPARWSIDGDALKFTGSGGGEAQVGDGGDLVFAKDLKNFILELDWKVSKGGNSGIFYLGREIIDEKGDLQPIFLSAPEYQVLDNANHPDAQLGVDGNRQSASLYDMIPAKPQNQNPYGEWNHAKIMVYKGTVVHGQNGENVLEYHLWTPKWTEMLQASKFSQENWPLAFEALNNAGGENHEGMIGLQDHGDDVWYRNIRVKQLD